MELKKIAILGGAFDPVTKGHIATAQLILDECDIHEVWMMPAYKHVYDKTMASPSYRMTMIDIAIASHPEMKLSTYEIDNKMNGETFHCIENLLRETTSENYQFHFVIGMDNALSIDRWTKGELLQKIIPFLVVPRTGYPMEEMNYWFNKKPHSYVHDTKGLCRDNCSSTMVRDNITNIDMIRGLLDEKVLKYIQQNNIYGA